MEGINLKRFALLDGRVPHFLIYYAKGLAVDLCPAQSVEEEVAGPFVPKRILMNVGDASWRDALNVLWRDGAVILSGLAKEGEDDFRTLAAKLPASLFNESIPGSPRLLSPDAPVNGVHDELREAKNRGMYVPGSGLLPHTDGYVYGDDFPDFIFLLCEQPSINGGENALLDGRTILQSLLDGGREQEQLARWLETANVDLSEVGATGVAMGRPATGPIVQWLTTRGGRSRLKWRRQIQVQQAQATNNWKPLVDTRSSSCPDPPEKTYQSLWRALPSASDDEAAEIDINLQRFDALLQVAGGNALASHSFSMKRGEALVVDNYRVLHARAPYLPSDGVHNTKERLMWRIWAWTTDGSGPPPDGALSSNPINDKVFGSAKHGDL